MSNVGQGKRYSVYGLTVESEIDLPELSPILGAQQNFETATDVRIVLGTVGHSISDNYPNNWWVDATEDACLLRFPGIARFLVVGGSEVTIQKDPSATLDDVRTWLLGSGLAAVIHQRKLVPLHVSALQAPDGAIAFTGDSGAGKSTLAAHLNRVTRWPLISDDVSILYTYPEGLKIESGVNTMKLWKDALASLQLQTTGLKRDLTRHDKFHAIEPGKFLKGSFDLKRLIKLEWGDSLELRPLSGRRAFEVALGAIYRPELASICNNLDSVVAAAAALAASANIEVLSRPKGAHVRTGVLETIETQILR